MSAMRGHTPHTKRKKNEARSRAEMTNNPTERPQKETHACVGARGCPCGPRHVPETRPAGEGPSHPGLLRAGLPSPAMGPLSGSLDLDPTRHRPVGALYAHGVEPSREGVFGSLSAALFSHALCNTPCLEQIARLKLKMPYLKCTSARKQTHRL